MFARLLSLITCLGTVSLYSQPPSSKTPADQYVQDSNNFSFSLQKQTVSDDENFVFAPYSIFTCLSMVYAGAKGTTEKEIQKALSLKLNSMEAARASSFLRKALSTSSKDVCSLQFTSSNGLFADQDTFILSSFRELVQKNYQAELATLDFSKKDKALMTINGWISNETKGKIPELLKSSDIDSFTRLVLVNAAYFKGKWLLPFEPKATEDLPFHTTEDSETDVPMMQQTAFFSYYDAQNAQVLSLSFEACEAQDPRINCVIVLPKTSEDMATLNEALSPSMLKEWMGELTSERVAVQIPRFCMKKRLDLGSALSQMGMKLAFTEAADFSGIDGMHDLFLSKVLHESYFSLNEFGVEAAAGTSAVINVTAVGPNVEQPIPFTADHPFYFFLIDRKTNTILFAGKYSQPDADTCQ